jgi:hypothetical protein
MKLSVRCGIGGVPQLALNVGNIATQRRDLGFVELPAQAAVIVDGVEGLITTIELVV